MKKNKLSNIFTALIYIAVIGVCLWISEGNISLVAGSFFEAFLKGFLCILIFVAICWIFPKSWFAKIFKDKL